MFSGSRTLWLSLSCLLQHAATEALLVCTLVKILLDKTLLNRAAPAEEEEAAIEAGKAQVRQLTRPKRLIRGDRKPAG